MEEDDESVGPLVCAFVHGPVDDYGDEAAEEEHELVGVDEGASERGWGDFSLIDGDDAGKEKDSSVSLNLLLVYLSHKERKGGSKEASQKGGKRKKKLTCK